LTSAAEIKYNLENCIFFKENIHVGCPKPITTLHKTDNIVIRTYIIVVGMHASHFTSSTVVLAHIFVCNYKGKAAPLDAMKA